MLAYLDALLPRGDARLVPLEDELPGVGPAPKLVVVHVERVVVLPREHPGKYLHCDKVPFIYNVNKNLWNFFNLSSS